MNTKIDKKIIFGIFFLSLQIVSVIYSQFIHERFFCWRPYDRHTCYEIMVKINDKSLSLDEIEKRYRYRPKGWEPRSIHNIFSIISQYERTYGKNDGAQAQITYSVNGKPEKTWQLDK